MTLTESISKGRVAALEALRDRLAAEIDNCKSPRDMAALSNQFQVVLKGLDELNPQKVEKPATSLDEVRLRRESRVKRSG